jgi:predicted secreted Zn-dependent protease
MDTKTKNKIKESAIKSLEALELAYRDYFEGVVSHEELETKRALNMIKEI